MDVTLYINGKDAYKEWGVTLVNSSSLSALMTPPAVKDRISNESSLEHGTRYITDNTAKISKREISLALQFSAPSEDIFLVRYNSFCKELTEEWINIYTSFDTATLYKCLYQSCSQFTQYQRGIAKFTLKLVEPNPTDRTNSYV